MSGAISLTAGAEEALVEEASRARSAARRLRFLPGRLSAINFNAESLRKSLAAHAIDPGVLLDDNDNFCFSKQSAGTFSDAIEGRYFEDDLGGEKRRADRYSTR